MLSLGGRNTVLAPIQFQGTVGKLVQMEQEPQYMPVDQTQQTQENTVQVPASFVLGIQIYRDRSRYILGLSQRSYIDKVLERFGMQN